MQYNELRVGQELTLCNAYGLFSSNIGLDNHIATNNMVVIDNYNRGKTFEVSAIDPSGTHTWKAFIGYDTFSLKFYDTNGRKRDMIFTSTEAKFFKVVEPKPEVKCEETLDIGCVFDVAYKAPSRSQHYVLAKLMEEAGEIARAVNQPERVDEAVSGEAADIIITVLDLLYLNMQSDAKFSHLSNSEICCIAVETLNKQLKKKTTKWASKIL